MPHVVRRSRRWLSPVVLLAALAAQVVAVEDAELAADIVNPLSDLLRVPVVIDYDQGYGPTNGRCTTLRLRPVMSWGLGDDWRVVSRSDLPIYWQDDMQPNAGTKAGPGDLTQSLLLSPVSTGGWSWGAGPAIQIPTATDDRLGNGMWSAGAAAAVVRQQDAWTFGLIGDHLCSFAGAEGRNDVRVTHASPFVAYVTRQAQTVMMEIDGSYDWQGEAWSIPVAASFAWMAHPGSIPIGFSVGVRYWMAAPDDGPEGLGGTLSATFAFPR